MLQHERNKSEVDDVGAEEHYREELDCREHEFWRCRIVVEDLSEYPALTC